MFTAKGQYSIIADTNSCLIQLIDQQSNIIYAWEIAEIRYIDLTTTAIQLFDNVRSIKVDNSKIVNFATIAALKNQVDLWALQCTD